MDSKFFSGILTYMLKGLRVYSNNPIWRHILTELGATVPDVPNVLDVNLDSLHVQKPISGPELKSVILNASDTTHVLQKIFHGNVPQLSIIQERIVILLWHSGGMTGAELKKAIGYLPGMTTHSIDTAIYNLRKLYGRDFIKNENRMYKIGTV